MTIILCIYDGVIRSSDGKTPDLPPPKRCEESASMQEATANASVYAWAASFGQRHESAAVFEDDVFIIAYVADRDDQVDTVMSQRGAEVLDLCWPGWRDESDWLVPWN